MARKDAVARLYRRLLERRSTLLQRLRKNLQHIEAMSPDVGDSADAACAEFSSDMQHRMAAMESDELRQVERALKKFKRGRYGVCERCGRKIPVARLEVLPYAAYCIACQEVRESRAERIEEFGDWERVGSIEGTLDDSEPELGEFEIPE